MGLTGKEGLTEKLDLTRKSELTQKIGLVGKRALITGSATGLGKMAALALADLGCDVIINYLHSQEEADGLVKQLTDKGVRSFSIKADVSKSAEISQMVKEIEQAWGGIDILINNAGPFIRERRLFSEYTLEEIDYLIQGNFQGVLLLNHSVLTGMRKKRWGRIIHFGFGHAAEAPGWPHRAVYAAAKVGLVSFTKSLAVEEAVHGITVNMICPGDITGSNKEKKIHEVEHVEDKESPRGRPGTGEDISRVITFLCQPESDFITGNIMEVSGGLDPIRSLPLKI